MTAATSITLAAAKDRVRIPDLWQEFAAWASHVIALQIGGAL